jgi:predicted MFS family arabinose efflux permease
MTHRQLKFGYFSLTALNTIGTSYYLNYLFFLLRDEFGFRNRENLWVSALHGFIYIFSAWQCGKFAQKRGLLLSLKLGFGGLALFMVIGALVRSIPATLVVVACYSVVLLFTWPALEALVSEGETQSGVQNMVGIYNCTWAAAAAFAYFTGGALYDHLGRTAVFWIPAGLFTLQLALTFWLATHARRVVIRPRPPREPAPHPDPAAFRQPVSPQGFLKMAWLANPFAFVAINTLWAVIPGLAAKFELSPSQSGLFCSVWLFGRVASFALLWKWKGWHYRFRWLLAAFLLLIVGFAAILLAPQLWMVVVAQAFFGLAVGHIYYSSLFYSMDVGEAQGEHGGLHEAAIGAGIFAGPAVGAATLQFAPAHSNTGVFAVSALLLCGLAGLIALRLRHRRAN